MDPVPSLRVSKLKKRFLDVLSGSVNLDPRGATLFLEGLCAQDDPVACLGAISASVHGLSLVQSAMQFDLSVQFMNGLGAAVLAYFLRASHVGGDILDNLLFHLVEPPIFWGVFVRTFQQGGLTEDAQLAFAGVLSRLLTLRDRDTGSYRDIATQSSVQTCLVDSPRHEIRELGHLIQHILSSTSVTQDDIRHGPGGRHDNDFVSFRDIAILPTADEILCRKPPFLRTAFHDDLDASESPVEDYLDNTFRMLREDMIFDIRQEIETVLQSKGKHRGFRVDAMTMDGIYTGPSDRKTSWGIKLQCSSDFRQLKDLKGSKARVNFLTRDPRGSKILKHQSLVCLLSGQDIISFGTVNRVEELLASNPPVIVLQLDSGTNIKKTFTSLRTAQNVQLVQINSATFAFEPVLSALKTCSVPLSKEILLWTAGSPLERSSGDNESLLRIADILASNPSIALNGLLDLPKRICLDDAQARSLVAGLQLRVSLIQGPPGTGKSFIGALLTKAIHDKTSQTILVVCFTNHALDQFLGDLLEYNIPAESIVRLGGRPNPLTDHLALHKQPRGRVRHDWSRIDELKSAASHHERQLQMHFDTLLDDNKNLLKYLEREHHKFAEAFQVSTETEDGMIRVGRNGEDIDENYLFLRWIRGLDAGVLNEESNVRRSVRIWGMARSTRQELLDKWRHELVAETLEQISRDGGEYNRLQDSVKQEFSKANLSILQQKRIIACTTTGAAIYGELLKRAGPEVLLVEEAGEILESHILIALSPKVNQMILIGDHKQLRPKVNNYRLTVEKGEGYDLNRSLFERLVLKGYPHETLSMQHRMRPEISAFVRELTYPELTDAASTLQRPDICGVQSNVIFVDHTHPEGDNSLVGDRADSDTKASKQNAYEVQMVLKIVRYLAQQGYKSEDIVVLTPYLGQLHQLRDALKKDNDPILNDLDASELARADPSAAAPSAFKSKKSQIHLATIDNYQGEESKIVIASLTRSNKSHAIGFMDSPERLNVLLSRARDGFIMIGNSQTFLHSKKGGPLWKRFFTLLERGQNVYEGFPVKCKRHSEVILLKNPGDFDQHCPDGGCTVPCGFMRTCGHMCPMMCHPERLHGINNPHDASQCHHRMSASCPAGHHKITWECRLGQPVRCMACAREEKRLEEIARQELDAQKKREEAEAEHGRRMAELEAKLQAEQAAAEKQRKLQEVREAQKREEDERRKREEERKRLHEEWVEKQRQKEESKRLLEQQAEKQRREERKRLLEQRAEKQRQEQMRMERAHEREEEERRKRREESKSLYQDYFETMKMIKQERETQRQEQGLARVAPAVPQPKGEKTTVGSAEPGSSSRCTIQ